MRPFLIALLLAGCSQGAPPPAPPVSPCHEDRFEGSAFTVCDGGGRVEIRTGSRSFATLQPRLGADAPDVGFAMNAGMFDDAGRPIGMMIEDGREVHAINRRSGYGNFHLMPNGVFLVRRDGRAGYALSDDALAILATVPAGPAARGGDVDDPGCIAEPFAERQLLGGAATEQHRELVGELAARHEELVFGRQREGVAERASSGNNRDLVHGIGVR